MMFDFEQRSTFLWPRYEVLQLVIPQIAGYSNGKTLTYDLVFAAIRKLVKCQNPDGLISFDRWLVIAKDVLKWNDSIITIFWEILMMASWYVIDHSDQQKSSLLLGSFSGSNSNKFDSYASTSHVGIDVNHLSIFLALHVDDTPAIPSSPRHTYDTMWPSSSLLEQREDTSNLNMNMLSISPSSLSANSSSVVVAHSPHANNTFSTIGGITLSNHSVSSTTSSPSSSQHSTSNRSTISSPSKHPPTSSPIHSPRSPQGLSAPTSPKRITPLLLTPSTLAPHQTRSAAQHLFSLKQKIPFLLKVISTDEILSNTNHHLSVESSPVHESDNNHYHDNDNHYNDRYDKSPRGSVRGSGGGGNTNHSSSGSSAANTAGLEFMISRAALDSLSLVIGGGLSRTDNVKKLSCLHPYWLRRSSSSGSSSTSNSLHNSREHINNSNNNNSNPLQNVSARDRDDEDKESKRGGRSHNDAKDNINNYNNNNNNKSSNNSNNHNLDNDSKDMRSRSNSGTSIGNMSQREGERVENIGDNMQSAADILCFSELSSWIDDNLTINETFHPNSGSSSSSSSTLTHSTLTHSAVSLQHTPSYVSLGGCGPSTNVDFKSPMLISPRNGSTPLSGSGSSGSGRDNSGAGTYSSPRRMIDELSGGSSSSSSGSSSYNNSSIYSPSSSPHPNNTSSSSSSLLPTQAPFRVSLPLSEVKSSAPTIVRNCATTVIFNVTNSSGGSSVYSQPPSRVSSAPPSARSSQRDSNNNNNKTSSSSSSSSSGGVGDKKKIGDDDDDHDDDDIGIINDNDDHHHHHHHHSITNKKKQHDDDDNNNNDDDDDDNKKNIDNIPDFGLSPEVFISPRDKMTTTTIQSTTTTITTAMAESKQSLSKLQLYDNENIIIDNVNNSNNSHSNSNISMNNMSGSKHVTIPLPLFLKTNTTHPTMNSSSTTTATITVIDQLPHAVITGSVGAHIYLLAPYASATLSHCVDCEIVLGAVAGAVVMNFCEKVSITTACRKLFVVGCVDCRINVATLSTSVILGDCRGNCFGPYNTAYKSLRNHMSVTHLQSLTSTLSGSRHHSPDRNKITTNNSNGGNNSGNSNSPPNPSHATGLSFSSTGGGGSLLHNHWSVFTDILSCLETAPTAGSPSGYALDAVAAVTLPMPPVSVAHQLPHDHFKPLSIPYVAEYDGIQNCPIQLPMLYTRALQDRSGKITDIRERLLEICSDSRDNKEGGVSMSGSGGGRSTRNRSGSTDTVGVAAAEGRSRSSSKTDDSGGTSVTPASLISQLQLEECEGSGSDKSTAAAAAGGGANSSGSDHNSSMNENEKMAQHHLATAAAAITSPTFNMAFMDWMVATGRSQQLLQLVRLDATDAGLVFNPSTTSCSIPNTSSSSSSSSSMDTGASVITAGSGSGSGKNAPKPLDFSLL